jgi:hypothetical protein
LALLHVKIADPARSYKARPTTEEVLMSTLEIPASIALLLVMASLALSLNSERRQQPTGSFLRPAQVTPTGSFASQRFESPALVSAAFRVTAPEK